MQPSDFTKSAYRIRVDGFTLRISFVETTIDTIEDFQACTVCVIRVEKFENKKMRNFIVNGISLCNPNDKYVKHGGYIPALKDCYSSTDMCEYFSWHDLRLALRTELEK